MNKCQSQKPGKTATLKANPLFYLRPYFFALVGKMQTPGFWYEVQEGTNCPRIQVNHLNSFSWQWLRGHFRDPSWQVVPLCKGCYEALLCRPMQAHCGARSGHFPGNLTSGCILLLVPNTRLCLHSEPPWYGSSGQCTPLPPASPCLRFEGLQSQEELGTCVNLFSPCGHQWRLWNKAASTSTWLFSRLTIRSN